ncbi:hypothetical protein ACFL46_03600 [Candidatus Neomarinimicrobiota bacterium]
MTEINTKEVRLVLGHRILPVAQKCIHSIVDTSVQPLEFIIHDDGTLTENDWSIIKELFNPVQTIRKDDSDKYINNILKDYPASQYYRDFGPTGLKLFDIHLLCDSDLFFFDADILFTKKFIIADFWELTLFPIIFQFGEGNAYRLSPIDFLYLGLSDPKLRINIKGQINSGIIAFKKDYYDLDFVEYFLSNPFVHKKLSKYNWWYEQTVHAILGSKYGCGMIDKKKIANTNSIDFSLDDQCKLAGVHFTSPYRELIDNYISITSRLKDVDEIIEITITKSAPYGWPNSIWKHFKAKLKQTIFS